MITPSRETIAKRIKAGWEPERARKRWTQSRPSRKRNEPSRSWKLRNGSNKSHDANMPLATRPIPQLSEAQKANFAKKVKKGQQDECWPWVASRNRKGYGQFAIQNYPVIAHRIAYILEHGSIPNEAPHILHRCDNPPCCNPAHLFAGTNEENIKDMVAKGRSAKGDRTGPRLHPECMPRGSRHHGAKLNETQVVEIRRRRKAGDFLRKIANAFMVSEATIRHIIAGKIWRHVP